MAINILRPSRSRAGGRLEESPTAIAALYEITPAQAKSAAKKMEFWPIRYPKLQLLLVFVAFAGICFACYRLTLTVLLMLVIHVIRMALKALGIEKQASEPVAPAGD